MLQQEEGIPYISEQSICRSDFEMKIERTFTVNGGILADAMGYGKTACMIARIRETRERSFGPMMHLPKSRRAVGQAERSC